MKRVDLKTGNLLVKLARKAVKHYLTSGGEILNAEQAGNTPRLKEERGIFVTIKRYPSGELRGCIGYPEPILPLPRATVYAAISAAVNDPRFHPISVRELREIIFEVTILTPPEEIRAKPEKIPENIEIGRDGLIIKCGISTGLLLPQVPVEFGWNEREFLSHLCIKAGLPTDCWTNEECKIFKFQGQIFAEIEPNGEIVEEVIE